ncbi:MAG TPA: hypothetical protein DCQ06_11490, partial [Myxococcales bacterium]|nr:hypothetical protein [Myxococcales bacterium]
SEKPDVSLVPPVMKRFVAAQYPPALFRQALRGSAVVQLLVKTDGTVGKVTLVQASHPAFVDVAIEAAQSLTFQPATRRGQPVEVSIRFRYRFRPEVRRRGRSRGLGRYGRRTWQRAPSGFSSVLGRVVERGTGRPLRGALIVLPSLQAEALSDAQGRFRFGLLPAGQHPIYLPGTEHKSLRTRIRVRNGRTTRVTLRPERQSYVIYRATAEQPPEPGEMTRRSLSAEEIEKIPGVYGDAFRVVQNLPGVSRSASGALVVRGSAPQDTQVMIEGLRVPLLYHFGGLYSVVNTDVLAGVDFLPGGYPVRFGRGTGGILGARLALPKSGQSWSGTWESNLFHTGLLLKAPLGERTWLTLAARRSYVDYVLDAVVPAGVLPFTQAPRYWDFQVKIDHLFSDKTNMTVFAFGSDDSVSSEIDEPPRAFPEARGDLDTATTFYALLAVLRHQGQQWSSRTMVGSLASFANASLGDQFRLELSYIDVSVRQAFTFGEGPLQLRTGLDLTARPFSLQVLAPIAQTSGERGTTNGNPPSQGNAFLAADDAEILPAIWFDAVFRLSPNLEVVPGLRVDLFRGIDNGETFTPRLNTRYRAAKGLVFKAATGLTSQAPQPPQLLPTFGTPTLLPQRGWQSAVGVEWQIVDAIDLDMSVFHKRLWDVVTPNPGLFPSSRYSNSGTGRIWGLELLLRHRRIGRFFGWLSYTLQRATRRDFPGAQERLFGWDQTHIITAVGSWKLPDNWEIGLRFRLTSGNPQTPLGTAVYNESNDTYTRALSECRNCIRLPAFHQLDLRVDRKFVFDRWILNVYIDVQNSYNRQNPEFLNYNFDATLVTYGVGLPIIPSLGLKAQF